MSLVVDTLIAERAPTHGDYAETAGLAQGLKAVLRRGRSWDRMTAGQREAAELIATKLARIVCGEPNFPDHWSDIGGYAELGGSR